ncbi:hypothetical protein PYCCODRAFT_961312 [Trametes coccinea BRFM310]|uniref:Uncharacterized protein n=1 Tax=Trametes coccinea (strain BRFM310) TaxID=1353009 RepID=A0A1Y2IZU5_TRAC3|nr:hypothetical protein PYCCODRAFT_961312 [Trametes coccinea BRFM310]
MINNLNRRQASAQMLHPPGRRMMRGVTEHQHIQNSATRRHAEGTEFVSGSKGLRGERCKYTAIVRWLSRNEDPRPCRRLGLRSTLTLSFAVAICLC